MSFSIADNLDKVRKRIQKATISASRANDEVTLLAVSKKKPAEMLYEAFKQGLNQFGENYLNEALEKQSALRELCADDEFEQIVWHFIGPIQSNKTKPIAEHFAWVQSVDRLKIAQRLDRQRPEELPPLNVCLQINIDEEETKSGAMLEDLDELALEVAKLPRLKLRGLMCIPRAGQSEQARADSFSKMLNAYDRLRSRYPQIDTLSMGMSGDLDAAIMGGSTMVRVGTALFGKRD